MFNVPSILLQEELLYSYNVVCFIQEVSSGPSYVAMLDWKLFNSMNGCSLKNKSISKQGFKRWELLVLLSLVAILTCYYMNRLCQSISLNIIFTWNYTCRKCLMLVCFNDTIGQLHLILNIEVIFMQHKVVFLLEIKWRNIFFVIWSILIYKQNMYNYLKFTVNTSKLYFFLLKSCIPIFNIHFYT